MKKLFLILALAVFSIPFSNSQNVTLPIKFDKKILDHIFVTSIAINKNNIAWIGTFKNGLIRYDGKETIFYNSKNSCINDTVSIPDIKIDGNGNIWIANNALIKYDGKKFTLFNSHNSKIPEDYVSAIVVDSKNTIWFTSCRHQLGGLVKYDGKNFTVFTPKNSKLPVNLIQSIAIDKNDNLWLAVFESAGTSYLVKKSNDNWTKYGRAELGFSPYNLRNIKINSKNEVYVSIDYSLSSSIGGEHPTLFTFNGQKSEILKSDKSFGCKLLNIDHEDNLWCAENSNYSVYSGNKWIQSGKTNFEGIFAIEQTKDNKIWMGTGDGVYIQTK
ncbi:hypothetical protein [Aurantibacillus circumpalustris]|uniref:hypothetical protein n=1 Tax=Aurantibacillus circumpalustris TaxID=3036359 RepID=UPI00295C2C2D|nr:hypothetical protein [Aurantibacillus circumpalustris]